MWTGILGLLGAIPGLGAFLARLGLAGGAYVKGRVDQATNDRLADAEARAESERAGRLVQEELRRLGPDARRDRLRQWERRK
jgi:hypothetical protein